MEEEAWEYLEELSKMTIKWESFNGKSTLSKTRIKMTLIPLKHR